MSANHTLRLDSSFNLKRGINMEVLDDLTLGRGRLYFAKFADGTTTPGPEMFFGNCPTVQLAQANTALDHYRSTQGLKVKDRTVTLQNDMTGTFSTDNAGKDNLALWFLSTNTPETTTVVTPVVAEPHAAKLGSYIQLGTSLDNPSGIRNVSAVTVKIAAVDVDAAGNYEVDLVKGRIYIEPDATDITDADALLIGYTPTAGTSSRVIENGNQIFGALRFISDNPEGTNKDYFFPYVQLTSSGNLDLIADTWQTLTFAVEVLKLDDNTSRVYID